jgi:threonine aldolase
MEAAAFCPSGTMTNQIAINVHTRPGDEIICSSKAHVYLYEGGGIAFNSGVQVALIDTPDGTFGSDAVIARINPDDPHRPRTSLVTVENTVNRGGGKIWDQRELMRISEICRNNGLKYHLDGARIFNALTETGENPAVTGTLFDSVSVCLSKGLGAPVGSLLAGSSEFIRRAKRVRKVMGGTMRQAGYIAGAGIYALENNITRLKSDHLNAVRLNETLQNCHWVESILPADTNIVIFSLKAGTDSARVKSALAEKGILAGVIDSRTMRLVTHLNVTDEMIEEACGIIACLFN